MMMQRQLLLRAARRLLATHSSCRPPVPIPLRHKLAALGAVSLGAALYAHGAIPERRPVRADYNTGGGGGADSDEVCRLVREGNVARVRDWLRSHSTAVDPAAEQPAKDPRLTHSLGWTALHVACANRDLQMAQLLLDAHAVDVNAQETRPAGATSTRAYFIRRRTEFSPYVSPMADTRGFTALHYAVVLGDVSIVRLLLERGADPTIRTGSGHLAKEYFDADEQPAELLKLLEQAELDHAAALKVRQRELRRNNPLEQKLRQAIVGQLGPINSVASAIRRKENGWADEDRPLVFLFLGSSGIGKTELAKQIAKYHADNSADGGFIRLDMSEFQSKHEVSKFIGSPPGYVGFEEGGQLTSKLKETPSAIVLLDEVEKAHIDVLTIMLQVFDDGRLTDGKGNTVDCKDAIFIMTSNLAQHEIADEAESLRKEIQERNEYVAAPTEGSSSLSKQFVDHVIYPILRNHFKRDEFLGRIDEVLFFLPFTRAELMAIVELELTRWRQRAVDKHNVHLSWTPEVVDKLSEGYNIRYGARSIKHEVEKRVINQIARAHEQDQLGDGGSVEVKVEPQTGDICLDIKFTPPAKPSTSSRFKLW